MTCQDKLRYHFKKQIGEQCRTSNTTNTIHHQNNGKTEYRGCMYAKNNVVLQTGWISDAFELRDPEFYKLVTTVTHDDDSQNIYTVPVGR